MTAIPSAPAPRVSRGRILVWDFPTRVFHWALVALVILSWVTGEDEGAALIHRLGGEAIAGLIVFRVIWGFVGGGQARFADFLKGPGAIGRHLRELLRGRAERSLGHNPLGGISVLLLLAAVSFVVVTGLFSAGDEGPGGPFAGRFGLNLADLHEPAFRILQVLVVVHLLGVAATSLASRENLVRAMITGAKPRTVEAPPAPPRRASALALLVAVALGVSTAAYLMALPHPSFGATGAQAEHHGQGGAAPAERSED
jgi:cytochrome b